MEIGEAYMSVAMEKAYREAALLFVKEKKPKKCGVWYSEKEAVDFFVSGALFASNQWDNWIEKASKALLEEERKELERKARDLAVEQIRLLENYRLECLKK